MLIPVLKWVGIGLALLVVAAFGFALWRFGPAALTLAWAKDAPNGPAARPAITLPFDADAARRALAQEVYGAWPAGDTTELMAVSRDRYLGGDRVHVTLAAKPSDAVTLRYGVSVVRRAPDDPLIVWSSFSPRGAAIPGAPGARMEGAGARMLEFGFGRYIQSPPLERILDAGFGLAVIHPPDALPDRAESVEVLRRMGEDTGAIMGWAWMAARALDALETVGEAQGEVIAAGHSRYGKAALVWAAWDARVDGVIAHQSGTGGASLSRDKRGETVAQMVESYPHWFAPGYAEESLSVDQHHLLALIAPRPVLLGGARRDVWSDPNGALRAAIGAQALWPGDALSAERLDVFVPGDAIAIWTRPGTHGIVEEDWPAFLQFLRAHFVGNGTGGDDEAL